MLNQAFKLARKTLLKNKFYTFINVFGLTCGMLAALIIAKYIGYSLQRDSFHVLKDRIYAINQQESLDGNPQPDRAATYWGVGGLLPAFPEVANTTRYGYHVEALIMAEEEKGKRVSFVENSISFADSNFLKIFTFPLLLGDSKTALSQPNSIVLTQSAAQRYFGNTDPIGQTLTTRVSWGEETVYKVTGVLQDIPQRSQFRFDFLVTPQPRSGTEGLWEVPDCSIYALLKENANATGLAKKLNGLLQDMAPLKANNRKVTASLASIADVQLSTTEYLLVAVGIFIVIICWVNYINQLIAQCYWRMKQTSILRVMGASRMNLRTQFILESSLICLTALALVIGLYSSLEQPLQSFTNGHLLPLTGDPTAINFIFGAIFVAGIVLAAMLPAAILFRQRAGAALRNVEQTRIGSMGLRKALVVVQFSISTVLMISIFVISGQLKYLRAKDKGVDMENILVVKAPMVKDTTWQVKRKTLNFFKEKCAELSFVTDVTSSSTVPGEEYRNETYLSFQGKGEQALVHQNGVDEHFFQMYGAHFMAGHDFLPDARAQNRQSIILNESAARGLGMHDFAGAINSKLVDHESDEVYDLIGIIKDYHQTPLKFELEPMAFKFNEFRGHISLKINKAGLSDNAFEAKLGAIQQLWTQAYHDASFDAFFLTETFEAQNLEDQYLGKLFEWFTALSIVISCLGLFGMSLLISNKRQREIGIRRVFGASPVHVLTLFLKGYLGSLVVAVAIGTPLAYALMNNWLRDYAYRIDIGIELLAPAILGLTLLFLLTVAYHTIKSARANPVRILRD